MHNVPKRGAGKQGWPWSVSTLFALKTGVSVNRGNNKNQPDILLMEMDLSKEVKSPMGISGLTFLFGAMFVSSICRLAKVIYKLGTWILLR